MRAFLSTGVKWLGREADLSPPSSAEVKNEWSFTSAALIYHHGVQKDSFNFHVS